MDPTELPAGPGIAELFDGVGCVLFDFDGPLVHLFAERKAAGIAARILDGLRLHCPLEDREFADPTDPHGIVAALQTVLEKRLSPAAARELVRRTERELAEEECGAAASATATVGAVQLVRGLVGQGRRVAITSNNASRAISTYLARAESAELRAAFQGHIYGRSANPDLMKPDPYCVLQALKGLKWADPDQVVLIGDSPSDRRAAQRAGVRFLGYARNARKRAELREAQALHLIAGFEQLQGMISP
jgi:phosphoglycolate phosphatase